MTTSSPSRLLHFVRMAAASITVLACANEEPPYARFKAPWTPFITTGDARDMAGAYDSSRLVIRGDTVEVWLRFQHATPQPFPSDPTRTFSVVETLQLVRCAAGQTSDVRAMIRDAADDSVGGYTPPSPRWTPFTEHALSDRVLIRLCRALDNVGLSAP